AVVLKVPAIFIFENNGWGEGTGHDYAVGSRDIAARAAGFGMPAKKVDGTDFFSVHAAASESVALARAGGGPSTIEVINRRFDGHFLGDPMIYRTATEREQTRKTMDPLIKFREKVLSGGLLSSKELDQIETSVLEEIEEAAQLAAKAPS